MRAWKRSASANKQDIYLHAWQRERTVSKWIVWLCMYVLGLPNAHKLAKKPAHGDVWDAPGSSEPSSTAQATCASKKKIAKESLPPRSSRLGSGCTYASRMAQRL